MQEECRNIYKNARKSAGLTQEAAAERIAVSVESLRAYEAGVRVPPNDVVAQMVICYNTQYLAYQHVHDTNTLVAQIIPALEPRSLAELAIRVHVRTERFYRASSTERLLEIAEDNHVDESEQPEYDAFIADMQDIVQSYLELIFRSNISATKEGTTCPR